MAGAARRSSGERSIIYHGAMAGRTLAEINAQLASVGGRELPESSYRSVCKTYVPYFQADPSRLEAAIEHPPSWAQIRDAS